MTTLRLSVLLPFCFATLFTVQADDLFTQKAGEPFAGSLDSRPFFLQHGGTGKFNKEDKLEVSTRQPRGESASVYAKAAPAIVFLASDTGHGTGFLISKDGWIITNYHVVAGCRYVHGQGNTIKVIRGHMGTDGWMKEPYEAGAAVVYKINERQDLALLKLTSKEDLPFVNIGTELPKPGDDCIAIGHPGIGTLWSVRTGQVTGIYSSDKQSQVLIQLMSMTDSQRAKLDFPMHFQTNLDIHPGDSGGPLLDMKGNVIGVTSAFNADGPTSLSLHVHLSELQEFLVSKPSKPLVLAPHTSSIEGLETTQQDVNNDGRIDAVVGRFPQNDQILSIDLSFTATSVGNAEINKISAKDSDGFVPHFSMYVLPKLTIAFDSDLDGTFDRVLCDEDHDAEFDTVFRLSGSDWTAEKFNGDCFGKSDFQAVEAQSVFRAFQESLRKLLIAWKEIVRSQN